MTTAPARSTTAGALALLLALTALVYAPLLRPGEVPYSPYSDVMPSHLAAKSVLAQGLAQGELPLWRRDLMLGAPAATDPQALYGHPLQALFALVPALEAFGPTYVLEVWIAAAGAFALARALGCSMLAALLAGIAQLVSFKLMIAVYAGWSSVMPTLCLLPLLAAALVRVGRAPEPRAMLLLAGVFALVLSGGTPQTVFYLGLVLGPYLIVAARAYGAAAWRSHAFASVAMSAGAFAIGVAATAYLWVPLIAELPLLSRGSQGYGFFLSGHGLSLRNLLTWLHPELLGTPVDGSYAGTEMWEDVLYFGALPLVGVLFALARALRPGAGVGLRYLACAFVATALLSIDSPFLRAVHALVPGYAVFRLPGRMAFVTAIVGVALAALVLDSWLARCSPRVARGVALALALAMLAEGAYYAQRYLTTQPAHALVPIAGHPARAITGAQRVAVVGRSAFNYGWAESLELRLLNGYNPYSFAAYKRYIDLTEHGSWRGVPLSNWFDLRRVARPDLVREAGVTHVLSQTPLGWEGLELVAQRKAVPSFVLYKGFLPRDVYAYRLRDARGLAWFAARIEPVASLDAMADAMKASVLDGHAFVLAASGLPPGERPGDARDAVTVRHARFGHIELQTESAAAGFLVIAEAFHPGWRARVDGSPAALVQTNLALQGLWLPAGAHSVELGFAPVGFGWAAPLALGSWLALLLALALSSRGRRTQERAVTLPFS